MLSFPRRVAERRDAVPFRREVLLLVVAASISALMFAVPLKAQDAPKEDVWRIQKVIGDPDWFRLSGEIRLRYEGLGGQFRSPARLDDSDHLGMQRTLLRFDFKLDPVGIQVEIMDARHYGGDRGSSLDTTHTNALDILQANITVDLGQLGSGSHAIKVGRYTMDIASRRLVARNRFRNTINSFTGVQWQYKGRDSIATAFWNMPVRREPTDLSSILDNDIQFDDQDLDLQFFGGAYELDLNDRDRLEFYALGLVENRGNHRKFGTGGGRLVRKKKRAEFDFEAEGAFQLGESRASATGRDLDHYAGFAHLAVGYTFDCDWKPRLQLAMDFASGDRDDVDGNNNRFDTLFGARRWEYGPTGIYGAIARSNLLSPEVRLELQPTQNLDWMIAARSVWLASDEDAWTTAGGVRDVTGSSGTFVGQQIETRLRWDIVPGNLKLDAGFAYLFAGTFQERAPGGQGTDTAYGYVQLTFQF